jgi:hypothetical protein
MMVSRPCSLKKGEEEKRNKLQIEGIYGVSPNSLESPQRLSIRSLVRLILHGKVNLKNNTTTCGINRLIGDSDFLELLTAIVNHFMPLEWHPTSTKRQNLRSLNGLHIWVLNLYSALWMGNGVILAKGIPLLAASLAISESVIFWNCPWRLTTNLYLLDSSQGWLADFCSLYRLYFGHRTWYTTMWMGNGIGTWQHYSGSVCF